MRRYNHHNNLYASRALCATMATVLLLSACGHSDTATEPPMPIAPDTASVPSAPSASQSALTLTGTVVPDPSRSARIVAPIDGRVEELAVEVGDDVAAGQRLARLVGRDAAELSIQRRQAEAECTLADREARLKASLFDDGLVSERELAEARERRDVARSALEQMTAFATGDIRASRRGTVLRRAATNGQYVQAGDLLLELADIGIVWVMGDVYESDICRVREGDSVSIATIARPDELRLGTIDKVYSALDPDSKTMKVRIKLSNSDRHLLPGMFAKINVRP